MAQLLVFPLGRAWVRLWPSVTVFGLELNPGPFSIKEHVSRLSTAQPISLLIPYEGVGHDNG